MAARRLGDLVVRPMKPRLLDLFCGAGGAAEGYARAGFEVVGVDIKPQPNYPFEFHQADALTFGLSGFDAVHASPPCQAYIQRNKNLVTKWPKLIEPVRGRLLETGLPFVIENVSGAPLTPTFTLCGTMFDLPLLRHRIFETNWPETAWPPPCNHWGTVAAGDFAAVYAFGGKGHRGRDADGNKVRGVKSAPGPDWAVAMGIDWMTKREMAEAIPPAYTEFIGAQLIQQTKTQPLRQVYVSPGDVYGSRKVGCHACGWESEAARVKAYRLSEQHECEVRA